nr:aldo/keto reductase [Alpinimonas psychrophila]
MGTVQFGLNYGITNASGELSDNAVIGMLRVAREAGISLFDTAANYGSSQQRLGEFASSEGGNRYVTKFSLSSDGNVPSPENLYGASMEQLRAESLHAVLFHKIADLADIRCQQAIEILREARSAGIVSRIGVSIYNASDLENALDVFPDLDILQLPANILDSRLLESEPITRLRGGGAEIHVRSVLLQGILLSEPASLPAYFDGLRPALHALHEFSRNKNIAVLALALGAMRHHPSVDAVLVGATSEAELEGIVRAWQIVESSQKVALPVVPAQLLDPRNWPAVRLDS